jgi:hypothetical protein
VVASHPSEAGVTRHPTDFTIVNDGTLEDLGRNVDELMRGLIL